MNFPWRETPSRFSFWNSPARARRADFGNRSDKVLIFDFRFLRHGHGSAQTKISNQKIKSPLGLRVPRVVDFHPFWKESAAAPLTAPGENRAPAFCLHARAKAELALASPRGRLISAFHRPGVSVVLREKGGSLATRLGVSTNRFAGRIFRQPSALYEEERRKRLDFSFRTGSSLGGGDVRLDPAITSPLQSLP